MNRSSLESGHASELLEHVAEGLRFAVVGVDLQRLHSRGVIRMEAGGAQRLPLVEAVRPLDPAMIQMLENAAYA